MAGISGVAIRRVLETGTDRGLLRWQPMTAVASVMTVVHIFTSVDLGFRDLGIRMPIAFLSLAPLIVTVALAHRLADRHPAMRIPLVLLAYFIGGALRGWVLQSALLATGVLTARDEAFRVPAGAVLVTMDAFIVNYAWKTVSQTRERLAELSSETAALEQAVLQIASESEAAELGRAMTMSMSITDELTRIGQVASAGQQRELQRLVTDVVRPLSHDFAKDISRWKPMPAARPQVTLSSVWATLDPLRHLPTPLVASLAALVASAASLLTVFGWRNAIEMAVLGFGLLTLSMSIGFRIARRLIAPAPTPWRDLLITIGFVLIAIPPALGTRVALADSQAPDAYVIPTLFAIPLFGWILMTGNAAADRVRTVTAELADTRDRLRWSIARINLLNWYHRGVVSRLLHGPVQNTIQVGVMRIKSADDEATNNAILREVIERIESAIRDALDHEVASDTELNALSEIPRTWAGIAEVSISVDDDARAALFVDPSTAGITVDMVQEACSNAVRHGNASRLDVGFSREGNLLLITIVDDGVVFDRPVSSTGLGTEFLDACAVSWQRRRIADTNVLTIRLPIAVSAPSSVPQPQ